MSFLHPKNQDGTFHIPPVFLSRYECPSGLVVSESGLGIAWAGSLPRLALISALEQALGRGGPSLTRYGREVTDPIRSPVNLSLVEPSVFGQGDDVIATLDRTSRLTGQ